MTLTIPYKKNPDSSGGFYYAAFLPVNIARAEKNAPRSKRFEALIDSGASACMFNSLIGTAIGLDVTRGELIENLGIAGVSRSFMHEIHLYAPGGIITT